MLSNKAIRGFSLIELMIGLVVLGIVLMVGLPSLATWLQNTQIRNQTEAVYAGLQLARAEALRRNTSVRFQLFDSLTASCSASTSGKNWVVSLADAAANCDENPSDTAAPQIIQKKDGSEGSANTVVSATGGSLVTFNGLGRVANAGSISQINITNPIGGACKTSGGDEPMRCLRIGIASGGQMRMCDPAVTGSDPRAC
jgi:type IV fimbrial biogenesis protein FimT